MNERGTMSGGLAGVCLAILAWLAAFSRALSAEPAGTELFERRIRPLLIEHCAACHGDEKQKGGLRLDSPAGVRAGGDKGPVLVAGRPAESRLIQAVGYEDPDLKMPPKTRLSRVQVRDLTDWIAQGAPMPDGPGAGGPEPARAAGRGGGFRIKDEDRRHWAFQPVARPAVPPVSPANSARVPNPIDAFLIARLEARGLAPNPPASATELLRRASYDLTGLPPAPEEVAAFAADTATNAWARRVDALLDSPHYGERWARHWLDLVRYGESNSYERDGAKPHVWRYRDYVIRSLNADKPYDRFVTEQLAGDELSDADGESLTATGFYRLGIWDDEPADRELARYDAYDDLVTTTGQVFLGLTVDCARCHNHKIDPISQADYYRFLSFFRNVNHYRNGGPTDVAPVFATARDKADHEAKVEAWNVRRAETKSALAGIEKSYAALRPLETADPERLAKEVEAHGAEVLGGETFGRYRKLRELARELEQWRVPAAEALVVTEAGAKAPDTFILLRGNPGTPGDRVEPGFPEILGQATPEWPASSPDARTSGRRTGLARWLTSPANPLTARVMVNRIWQHHFGRGIVGSSSNFGLQGDRPSHPELLDWLAAEFVAKGWSIKAMHRLILNSNAYRMSSRGRPDGLARDIENQLLWRFNMRRLTGEEIRDSILAVTGRLNRKVHGPSVYVDIPKSVMATQSVPGSGWGTSSAEDQARRSIYIHAKRSLRVPILEAFDQAEPDRTTPVRFASVQPTQALGMINSDFLNQQARQLARRLREERPGDPSAQVRRGFSLVTSRQPSEHEVATGAALVGTLAKQAGGSVERALDAWCLLLLNLNEFIYLD